MPETGILATADHGCTVGNPSIKSFYAPPKKIDGSVARHVGAILLTQVPVSLNRSNLVPPASREQLGHYPILSLLARMNLAREAARHRSRDKGGFAHEGIVLKHCIDLGDFV